ncbi:MAG TPA: AtpZ/AtpI family protein [Alphaproteobacteria bacterium]|nr:AtpZ/AtpI family protein [Alphaproteobacteria bacterium]
MAERKPPPSLEELGARVREAQNRQAAEAGADGAGDDNGASGAALANGLRIGPELVVAVGVGTGIGWAFDRAFGSAPLVTIVFFFLGVGAGMVNVWRAVTGRGMAIGYRPRDARRREREDKKTDESSGEE